MSTTCAATEMPVDSPNRLTMHQAQSLFSLVTTFRPDWDDRRLIRKIKSAALYSSLNAAEVVAHVINTASTSAGLHFDELTFPGEAA